jgi:hypothetical protein
MLPALLGAGRFAMQALPYVTAAMGAAPGLKEGDLGKAALGAGLGYFGGGLGSKGIKGVTEKAAGRFAVPLTGPAGAAFAGTQAGQLMSTLGSAAKIGIPLAGAAAAVPLIGGLASAASGPTANIAGGAGRAALGAAGLGRTATFKPEELGGGPQYPTGAAPDISQYGYPGLVTQQNPLGPWQANIQYQKQLQDLENQNIRSLANYQLRAADEVKRRDFQRNAAAAQMSTMLATNSQMQLQGQQIAGAQAGQALANIGQIAGTQYRYL